MKIVDFQDFTEVISIFQPNAIPFSVFKKNYIHKMNRFQEITSTV